MCVMIKERTNEMADDGNLELRGRETCSISELRMLLEGRDPAGNVCGELNNIYIHIYILILHRNTAPCHFIKGLYQPPL